MGVDIFYVKMYRNETVLIQFKVATHISCYAHPIDYFNISCIEYLETMDRLLW